MSVAPGDSLRPGLTAAAEHVVTEADTAASLGSGALAVLGTPRLLAWLEEATCTAIAAYVGADESSVGTRMTLEHVRATPVGGTVVTRCELVHVDGRLLRFQVEAAQPDGVVVAHGEITRVIVATARFLARSAFA